MRFGLRRRSEPNAGSEWTILPSSSLHSDVGKFPVSGIVIDAIDEAKLHKTLSIWERPPHR